ncbi:MAG TPA: IS1182 family transposase [Brachyspira hyodysenteriae]|nr:IS1182 family transposase [Brachyspira hyodysenteriae]
MKNAINNNIFFKLIQPKIFNLLQYHISEDDPVRKLIYILEGMDFSKLIQIFSHKTKVHPIRMFAIILYAYSRGIYSTRDIQIACHENIKFRFLLQDSKIPNYSTFSRFLVRTSDLLPDLFEQFVKKIFELENISTDTIYIDGTKIEAYANKYTFVWRGSIEKYRSKLDEKIELLISQFNKDFNVHYESFLEICAYLSNLNIKFVKGRGHKKSKEQKYFEKCLEYLEKYQRYSEHFINFRGRNSYSKTDIDATFMRMKDDYMRNGQLKPGYNLQIGVISEYICAYDIFPNPSDSKTLIPFLEKIKTLNLNIKNVVADAGYESIVNYEYLEKMGYNSYIKPIYFEKSKTRKFKNDLNRVENLIYNSKENKLFRKDGLELKFLYSNRKRTIHYFFNPEIEKIIKYNGRFRVLSDKSKENISSEYGKQLRLNRSIQVEGAFAVLKENMKLRKLKVRGRTSVLREICLFCMGYNFNRYISRSLRKCKGTTLHPLQVA